LEGVVARRIGPDVVAPDVVAPDVVAHVTLVIGQCRSA
jgi:hypothetical protein